MHETFEHRADIGVRGTGGSLEEAFSECAEALFGVMTDTGKVACGEAKVVHVEATDLEALLVSFLNELIYLKDAEKMFFSKFDINARKKGEEWELEGKARGEGIDRKNHEIGTEVKGATFSQVKVEEKEGKWVAQCVVDV